MTGEFKIMTGTVAEIEQTLKGNCQSWALVEVKYFIEQISDGVTSTPKYTCMWYRKN